jgi:phosphatidylglycerol:prolipoprotein diacylglycerol transferase
MSFHGGLLGVMFSAYLFSRKYKISLGAYLDVLALSVTVGLGLGRIGNFINQELWGSPTDLPWGVIFPVDPTGLPRHPTQLYEALLEGFVLFLIIYAYTRVKRPDWSTGALFIGFYGLFRFLIELIRLPDAPIGYDLFGWMTRGQILSLPMIVGGILLWFWSHKHAQTLQRK